MAKSKSKKKSLSEAKSKKRTVKKLNPFEIKVNNDKFNVVGRQTKFDCGRPGVARSKAIKRRKETLLQEYKYKDKCNKFLDKRIGENNKSMTYEDKIMARFTAEQLKAQNKKTMFNLAEEEEILTHKGRSIAEAERFDDPRDDDEDEDEVAGRLDSQFVEAAHFGGGVLSKASGNRDSVIAELIAESKKRKAERQQAKEKTLELTEKLDHEWKDLIPIMHIATKGKEIPEPETTGRPVVDPYDTALKMLQFEARGKPSDKLKSEGDIAAEEARKLEQLEQERLRRMRGEDTQVKVTTFQHRSADDLDDGFNLDDEEDFALKYDSEGKAIVPSTVKDDDDGDDDDDIKTGGANVDLNAEEEDEEDSEDEDEEGSESEEDVLSDLQVESEEDQAEGDSSEDEDVETSDVKKVDKSDASDAEIDSEELKPDEIVKSKEINSKQNYKEVKFDQSGKSAKGKSLEDKNVRGVKTKTSQNVNDVKSEHKKSVEHNVKVLKSSLKAAQDPRDELVSEETKPENSENCGVKTIPDKSSQMEKSKVKFNTEVEKVTYGENASNIGKQTTEEIREMLQKKKELMDKARKELPYTFPAPEKYEELESLLEGKSADQVAVVIERLIKCHHPSLKQENKSKMADLFAFLMQHLNDMDPKECWRRLERLAPLLYDLAHFNPAAAADCVVDVLKEKQTDHTKRRHKYPSTDTLVFLKLIPILFPASDKRHPVTTPAVIFILQLLQSCKVTTRRSFATGLFLVSILYEYISLSKRFCPQALNFLCGIINNAAPPIMLNPSVVPPFSPSHRFLFLPNACSVDGDLKLTASDLCSREKIDDPFRVKCMFTALALLDLYSDLYRSHSDIGLALAPLASSLNHLQVVKYPPRVESLVDPLKNKLENITSAKLLPLSRGQKKPKALRLYEPSIEPVYDIKRRKGSTGEKAEREKLLHKYKREMKGALREIRRDTAFIANVKFKQQAASDAVRKRKVDEIIRWGAEQQHEANRAKKKIKSKF